MEYLFIPCFFCTFAQSINRIFYQLKKDNMKKLFLSLLISYSFSACAQSNYDSNVVVYDNVIEDEQVVQNTLVKHQKTINYYHVNETRENHYYLDNGLPHYYLHQRANNYRKRPTTYREPYYSSPKQSKYRYAKPISTNYSIGTDPIIINSYNGR